MAVKALENSLESCPSGQIKASNLAFNKHNLDVEQNQKAFKSILKKKNVVLKLSPSNMKMISIKEFNRTAQNFHSLKGSQFDSV